MFAARVVKTPPDCWVVEVRSPEAWRGHFRSRDGIDWWSPALDRPLGFSTPAELRVLNGLRTVVANQVDDKRIRVVDAARAVVMASDAEGGQPWPGVSAIRERLAELDAVEGRVR